MPATPNEVEEVIASLAQATEANFCTMGRVGNVVELTAELADEVMVTGDLHGHRENFERILQLADLDGHPRRHLVLQEVCHGGPEYPTGGGCMSHTLLEDVARLIVKYPDRVHFLLGNHELAEVADYPIQKSRKLLNLMFRIGLQYRYGDGAEAVREAYYPFLRSCPLAMRLPGGLFLSHSIPEGVDLRGFDATVFTRFVPPVEYLERSAVFELVWGRDYRAENARAFAALVGAKVLINGHEPCEEGYGVPNDTQIIIDCCSNPACYLLLPTDRELTHDAIIQQVQRLA